MKSLLGSWLPTDHSLVAQCNVLDLPELLENVLLKLPIRDLLFSQKVCQHWKATVDSSIRIQRALFFVPGTANDVSHTTPSHIFTTVCSEEDAKHSRLRRPGYAMNCLLVIYDESRSESKFRSEPLCSSAEPRGSWSRMFFTQPPCFTATCTELEKMGTIRNPRRPRWFKEIAFCAVIHRGESFGRLVEKYHQKVEDFELKTRQMESRTDWYLPEDPTDSRRPQGPGWARVLPERFAAVGEVGV
ncbi:hypothetical protein LTR49_015575 [Elasticomyces elasticus]|nr:hypothetical protein LTR49_015575 [Elasticomyces elasticus]